jgi:hypothetical protein
MAAARHRKRVRDKRAYDAARVGSRKAKKKDPHDKPVIGIDGEGYTDGRGRHRYVYMAASDVDGLVSELENPKGLTFDEVVKWLLSLSEHAVLVGYSLGYDRCKWLQSLPDEVIYAIEHPEHRVSAGKGTPRVSHEEYLISLLATRFSVARWDGSLTSKGRRNGKQRRVPKARTRVVWDLFRFFQTSFVKALRKWSIGSKSEVDRIEAMKGKRGKFPGIRASEKRYCQSECRLLAQLATALFKAHDDEGIHLDKFYGPGSTANVVLGMMKAGEQKAEVPEAMGSAADSAYFGGRFELSHVGPVKGRLYGYDIASAYPHAMRGLPCMAHGRFELATRPSHVFDAIEGDAPACVSYLTEWRKGACEAWGPLPHRLPDGNIVFPVESAGGWAWNVELRAAQALHPGIVPMMAWVWRRSCDCNPPFAVTIESLYARRKLMGKNGRGIVLKLALNSLYGKSAQRVGGGGKYRSIVRAGLITATTRAMLLQAVALAKDPWNVLELATDSVLSREALPLNLGSSLGQWEEKKWPRGAFLLRPGMRFSLQGEREHTAARGLGTNTLHRNRARILRAWERAPMGELTVQQPAMFHGSKSSLWRVSVDEGDIDSAAWEYRRSALYGQWQDPMPRALSYAPGPKRSGIIPSPALKKGIALVPWRLPAGLRSVPYRAEPSEDDRRMLETEQPEWGGLAFV